MMCCSLLRHYNILCYNNRVTVRRIFVRDILTVADTTSCKHVSKRPGSGIPGAMNSWHRGRHNMDTPADNSRPAPGPGAGESVLSPARPKLTLGRFLKHVPLIHMFQLTSYNRICLVSSQTLKLLTSPKELTERYGKVVLSFYYVLSRTGIR